MALLLLWLSRVVVRRREVLLHLSSPLSLPERRTGKRSISRMGCQLHHKGSECVCCRWDRRGAGGPAEQHGTVRNAGFGEAVPPQLGPGESPGFSSSSRNQARDDELLRHNIVPSLPNFRLIFLDSTVSFFAYWSNRLLFRHSTRSHFIRVVPWPSSLASGGVRGCWWALDRPE